MAPRHTQGCGGVACAQQTKNWCVGFSFPPPAYAGIHPTLYLFGFRANALNSSSPPYLPGFGPGTGLERFGGPRGLRKAGFGLSRTEPPALFRGLRGPPGLRRLPGVLFVPGRWVWWCFAFFPQSHTQKTQKTSLGFGFLSSESQKRRRGPPGGTPAPAPGGAAHALNHSLGLHSTSKQWCE